MRAFLCFALAVGALTGCASDLRYPVLADKNFVIRADIEPGVHALLGVHAVDAKCEPVYEGSVALDEPVVRVGIPPGRQSLLLFRFASSSFLGSRRSTVDREALLRPRAGATYDVRVSYRKDLYDVVLRESVAGGASREVPLTALRACSARS